MLGFVIFSEALPPLWWVGAAFLVAGNVIIGSKDESGKAEGDESSPSSGQDGYHGYQVVQGTDDNAASHLKDHDDEDIIQLGDLDD